MDMRLALILLFMVSMTMAMNLKRGRHYDDSEDYNEDESYDDIFRDVLNKRGCTPCYGRLGQTHASCCSPKSWYALTNIHFLVEMTLHSPTWIFIASYAAVIYVVTQCSSHLTEAATLLVEKTTDKRTKQCP